MSQTKSPKRWQARTLSVLVSAALHGSVVSILTALFLWVHLNASAKATLPLALSDEATRSDVLFSALIILGLAACTWALGVITYKLWRIRADERRPALKPTRGAIITETLIVFPVFLLLTFGLAQMGVNSMAGLLTSVATYQAGRTVAVWAPEIGHSRGGESVTEELVRDRARIVAAGIVAPVVPTVAVVPCAPSQAMQRTQTGMTGALVPMPEPSPPSLVVGSMVEALDTQKFSTRGVVKHALAYCAVDITIDGSPETSPQSYARPVLKTTVQYHHPNAMPLVGRIFTTNYGGGPWAMPHVTTMSRSYELTQQVSPNPIVPQHWIGKVLDTVLPKPGLGGQSSSL